MEASLLQVYAPRDPLGEFLREEITFRQLRVMVEGLPLDPSTPLGRVINGPWGDLERLAWDTANHLRGLEAMFYNAHKKKSAVPAEANPITPPPQTRYQRKARNRKARGDAHQRASESALLDVLNH